MIVGLENCDLYILLVVPRVAFNFCESAICFVPFTLPGMNQYKL